MAHVVDHNGKTKMIAEKINGLYFVREEQTHECRISSKSSRKSSDTIITWHRRLGHLNFKDLINAQRNGILKGLNFGQVEGKLECDICVQAKMTITTFPKNSERKTDLLDIVHSDVCGPLRSESLNKAKYFVTFIDDSSKSTSERKNRTLLEMARCILMQTGLPPGFWAEAISTANYIQNRCPTKSLNGKTPYEAWTGNIPNVSNFKEFGCQVFFLDSNPERGKFDKRSKKGIFLGYSDQSKAYRVWVPGEKKTVITRDIVFREDINTLPKKYEEFAPKNLFEKEGNETQNLAPNPCKVVIETVLSQNLVEYEIQPDEDPHDIVEGQKEHEENHEPAAAPRRARGKPTLLRTGLRGRPRKVCQTINADVTRANAEFAFVAEIPVKEAVNRPDSKEWLDAMTNELKSIIKNQTWEIVDRPKDAEMIGSRMVLRNKYKPDETVEKRKARLVARDFAQRPGIHFSQTFAPVARLSSIPLIIMLAVQQKMKIHQLDITTAYLNGVLEEEIYTEPPSFIIEALEVLIQKGKSKQKYM